MERFVRADVADRVARAHERILTEVIVKAIHAAQPDAESALTALQVDAVQMAVFAPLSVLCGSAGTGKTTVLRAVLSAVRAAFGPNYPVRQIALSGRAAKRMTEATGAEATTVYRYLLDCRLGRPMAEPGLLIVDEASMIDLPTMYRLLRATVPSVRLLFVGDPAQLPPIGPGLVFHRMVGAPSIPQVELTSIQRQRSETGIPRIGSMIRAGQCPALPAYDASAPHELGIFIHRVASPNVAEATLRIFEALAGPSIADGVRQRDIQLLCATRNGPAGTRALNEEIERRHSLQRLRTSRWGLSVGSKVIWVVNDHHRGTRDQPRSLLNGALGTIVDDRDDELRAEFDDGAIERLQRDDLPKLERGWAISVHKAQGSAFQHVIVPIVPSRLLDRALLYTAVTRAVRSAILVGDEALLRAAVAESPISLNRRVALRFEESRSCE
jgi:exodeoxyribonuclease V alpha subunit